MLGTDDFLAKAMILVSKSTCNRARVGCVIAQGALIIGEGWNGAPAGSPTCDEQGHLMHDGHCCRATHAEINALADATRRGYSLQDTTAYCTHLPCIACLHALIANGITEVYYLYDYRGHDAQRIVADNAMVSLVKGEI